MVTFTKLFLVIWLAKTYNTSRFELCLGSKNTIVIKQDHFKKVCFINLNIKELLQTLHFTKTFSASFLKTFSTLKTIVSFFQIFGNKKYRWPNSHYVFTSTNWKYKFVQKYYSMLGFSRNPKIWILVSFLTQELLSI